MTDSLADELLPCPFCGGEQITTAPEWRLTGSSWWCGCKACSCGLSHDTEADAITAWNTRSTPSQSVGEVADAVLIAAMEAYEGYIEERDGCENRCSFVGMKRALQAALSVLHPVNERGRIVAWLREATGDTAAVFTWAADAIERGDHLEQGNG